MQTLLCFLGLSLVICIRLLHRYAYDNLNCLAETAPQTGAPFKPNAEESAREDSRLLDAVVPSSGGSEDDPALTVTRRVVCSAAVVGYMVVAALTIKASVEEYHGAAVLLSDPRFMIGRGGMFVAAIVTIAHALGQPPSTVSREIQADGLTLLALPFILQLIGTPGASNENAVLDLLVEPVLGVACFLTAFVH
ncbi:hypothetical protein C8J57DRAFT_1499891 [Mycena rebaudengoi]|nr:hypothetical protein C8J57DRAFT_1499891 [Mycena rebaudengoi]